MKTYTGTKTLDAIPMTLGEYNRHQGWDMPIAEDPGAPGYLVEYQDGGEPNHPEHEGYISWSPKDVFERTYHEGDGHTPVTPVKGYRILSEDELADMNLLKQMEENLLAELHEMYQKEGYTKRWLSVAKTHIQQGFMAAIRSIARPNGEKS